MKNKMKNEELRMKTAKLMSVSELMKNKIKNEDRKRIAQSAQSANKMSI